MSSESFGDISLADYRRMAGPRRRLPRFALVAIVVAACALLPAAGAYSGLWSGHKSRELSYDDGMRLLEHPDALEFQHEGGMLAVSTAITRGLRRFEAFANRTDGLGVQARGYLEHIAILAVSQIEEATKNHGDMERLDRILPRRPAKPK